MPEREIFSYFPSQQKMEKFNLQWKESVLLDKEMCYSKKVRKFSFFEDDCIQYSQSHSYENKNNILDLTFIMLEKSLWSVSQIHFFFGGEKDKFLKWIQTGGLSFKLKVWSSSIWDVQLVRARSEGWAETEQKAPTHCGLLTPATTTFTLRDILLDTIYSQSECEDV